MTTTGKFNEQALLADVISVWGEYGAHADLVRWMIEEIEYLRRDRDAWRKDAHGE